MVVRLVHIDHQHVIILENKAIRGSSLRADALHVCCNRKPECSRRVGASMECTLLLSKHRYCRTATTAIMYGSYSEDPHLSKVAPD